MTTQGSAGLRVKIPVPQHLNQCVPQNSSSWHLPSASNWWYAAAILDLCSNPVLSLVLCVCLLPPHCWSTEGLKLSLLRKLPGMCGSLSWKESALLECAAKRAFWGPNCSRSWLVCELHRIAMYWIPRDQRANGPTSFETLDVAWPPRPLDPLPRFSAVGGLRRSLERNNEKRLLKAMSLCEPPLFRLPDGDPCVSHAEWMHAGTSPTPCRSLPLLGAVFPSSVRTHLLILTILEQLQETFLQKLWKALRTDKIHMIFFSCSILLMFATGEALLSSRSSKLKRCCLGSFKFNEPLGTRQLAASPIQGPGHPLGHLATWLGMIRNSKCNECHWVNHPMWCESPVRCL